MHANAAAVLDFWFGDEPQARPQWFRKDPAFDAQVAYTQAIIWAFFRQSLM